MSSNTVILPQLQALLDQAPEGSNPYAWWAETLYRRAYPGLAPWSVPLFWIVAILSFINLPVTIFTLVSKARSEGGTSLYKLREHRSGGRYICLNATNTFLIGHVLSCSVFLTFSILHLYRYDHPGRGWQDLCWAAFMWLCPYLELLFTSIGVLYAILVAPSPLAYAQRAPSDGKLVPHQPPLSTVPAWLLNAFIFAAPVAVSMAVLIPGIRLILAIKDSELFGVQMFKTVELFAYDYAKNITPSVAEQGAFLQNLALAVGKNELAASRWSPLFGIWLVFVAIASVLASVAWFAVSRVTKTRLRLAQQILSEGSGNVELDEMRNWERKQSAQPHQLSAVKQARWEHHSFMVQFGAAAILLLICDAMLFVDTVVGYKVHIRPNLVALCLLVPPGAYLIQSSISVALILVRSIRGQAAAKVNAAHGSPRSGRTTHTRTDCESTIQDKKKSLLPSSFSSKPVSSGAIYVSTLPKHGYPVSPSVVHQIQINQVIETEADVASFVDAEAPELHRSRSGLLESEGHSTEYQGEEGWKRPVSEMGQAM